MFISIRTIITLSIKTSLLLSISGCGIDILDIWNTTVELIPEDPSQDKRFYLYFANDTDFMKCDQDTSLQTDHHIIMSNGQIELSFIEGEIIDIYFTGSVEETEENYIEGSGGFRYVVTGDEIQDEAPMSGVSGSENQMTGQWSVSAKKGFNICKDTCLPYLQDDGSLSLDLDDSTNWELCYESPYLYNYLADEL